MKCIVLLCLVAVVTCLPADYSRFDSVDVDEVLGNERLLKSYVHCFLEKGKCTPEATDMKNTLPEVIKESCASCTEEQKVKAGKIVRTVKGILPAEYNEIVDKYGDKSKMDVYEEFIKKYAL